MNASGGCRLLVCAATPRELAAWPGAEAYLAGPDLQPDAPVRFAVVGAGVPRCLSSLFRALARHRPERLACVGMAGAYPGSGLHIGDVVLVQWETFGDLGFEGPGPGSFIPVWEQSFGEWYKARLKLWIPEELPAAAMDFNCRWGGGCTVNLCTGTAATGRIRRAITGADIETMEGAAMALAAAEAGVPCVEIRAVSNHASHRDMRQENIALALGHLTQYARGCAEGLLHAPLPGDHPLPQ